MIEYSTLNTGLGELYASANSNGLTHVWKAGQKYAPDTTGWQYTDTRPLFHELQTQLNEYAKGQRQTFDLPLAPEGTEFQQSVWQALRQIEYAELSSYGDIAKKLSRKTSARAVGSAVGRNPLLIIVPCHRVVGANGALTGFAAGLPMKQQLLGIEGQLTGEQAELALRS